MSRLFQIRLVSNENVAQNRDRKNLEDVEIIRKWPIATTPRWERGKGIEFPKMEISGLQTGYVRQRLLFGAQMGLCAKVGGIC